MDLSLRAFHIFSKVFLWDWTKITPSHSKADNGLPTPAISCTHSRSAGEVCVWSAPLIYEGQERKGSWLMKPELFLWCFPAHLELCPFRALTSQQWWPAKMEQWRTILFSRVTYRTDTNTTSVWKWKCLTVIFETGLFSQSLQHLTSKDMCVCIYI